MTTSSDAERLAEQLEKAMLGLKQEHVLFLSPEMAKAILVALRAQPASPQPIAWVQAKALKWLAYNGSASTTLQSKCWPDYADIPLYGEMPTVEAPDVKKV